MSMQVCSRPDQFTQKTCDFPSQVPQAGALPSGENDRCPGCPACLGHLFHTELMEVCRSNSLTQETNVRDRPRCASGQKDYAHLILSMSLWRPLPKETVARNETLLPKP